MTRRTILGPLLVALALALPAACVSPANQGHAVLASKVQGTLLAGPATAEPSPKTGRASSWAWFFLFAGGDASLTAAMADGGISTVHHVEYEAKALLGGLTMLYTTIVHGE